MLLFEIPNAMICLSHKTEDESLHLSFPTGATVENSELGVVGSKDASAHFLQLVQA